MNKALRSPIIYVCFILPALALFVAFFVYPLITSIYYSFTDWNGISSNYTFAGAKNFSKALQDPSFWKAALNNFYFIVFSLLIQLPLIIIFSLLIANVKRLKGFYKSAVFMPSIMSTAVIGILWGFIYNPDVGLLNKVLALFGIEPLYWLAEQNLAMLSILITNAWQWTGFYIILVLAAILGIPKEVEEAALIDGATKYQRATRITIPLIMPVISVVVLLSVAGAMKAADIVVVMTKGGPASTTDVLITYMIKHAITSFQYGLGNAITVLIFILTLIITGIYQGVFARRSERIEY